MSASNQRPPPNLLTLSNTKLAACFARLGFSWQAKLTIDVARNNREEWKFHFWGKSQLPEFAHLDLEHCIRAWESQALVRSDPMHPLCIMMAAHHNYDRMLDMIHGAEMRLRSAAGGCMTRYHPGPELEAMKARPRVPCHDLALAAAAGLAGVPVLGIDGAQGARRFWLAEMGYVLKDAKGAEVVYRADDILRRSPTPQWPHRLAWQDRDPMHMIVLGYAALDARAQMKSYLMRLKPDLKHRDGEMIALVSSDFTGRVMDRITARFGVAPIG
jgi:hypothetical protein